MAEAENPVEEDAAVAIADAETEPVSMKNGWDSMSSKTSSYMRNRKTKNRLLREYLKNGNQAKMIMVVRGR